MGAWGAGGAVGFPLPPRERVTPLTGYGHVSTERQGKMMGGSGKPRQPPQPDDKRAEKTAEMVAEKMKKGRESQ